MWRCYSRVNLDGLCCPWRREQNTIKQNHDYNSSHKMSNTCQYKAKVSANHLPRPSSSRETVTALMLIPQGLQTYMHPSKTSSNSAALFTNSVRRQREKSNFPLRNSTVGFFFFLSSYVIGNMAGTKLRKSEKETQQCIPDQALWIIYLQQLLWRRLRVYCTVCPFTWQLWSNTPSLVFTALL